MEESSTINKCPSFPPYKSVSVALSLGINVRSWTGDNNVRNDIKDIVGGDYFYVRHQRIDSPTEFIFLVDSTNAAGTIQAHWAASRHNGTSGPHVRHGGKANTLFADGHAKAISHGRLINLGFQYGRLQDGTHW